jgi:hypothetical protein
VRHDPAVTDSRYKGKRHFEISKPDSHWNYESRRFFKNLFGGVEFRAVLP